MNETLAKFMGNTPQVAFDHYGKEWGQHYQEPLWAAIGEGVTTTAANTATKKSKSKSNAKTNASRARSTKPR